MSTIDLTTMFTGASTDLIANLAIIAPVAIGVGIAVLSVRRGWKWFKGLSN